MKIAINSCYGSFCFTIGACKWFKEHYGIDRPEDLPRDDPRLIDGIEQLGDKCSVPYLSKIKIVEVPDDIDWYIQDYDGIESVHEVHRSWS